MIIATAKLFSTTIDPAQIIQKSKQKYPSFLSALVTGVYFFPITFPIGSLPKEYNDLRDAIGKLNDRSKDILGYGYTVQTEVRMIHAYGKKTLPKLITIDTEQDYLRLLERTKEVRQFRLDVELIRQSIPELFDWIYNNPEKVIKYSDRWQDLLKVCEYFKRSYFPQVRSIMMDMETYQAFQEFAVSIETPITQPPAYLTELEKTLYTYLVSHQQRLEQERITQEYANKIIHKLI